MLEKFKQKNAEKVANVQFKIMKFIRSFLIFTTFISLVYTLIMFYVSMFQGDSFKALVCVVAMFVFALVNAKFL